MLAFLGLGAVVEHCGVALVLVVVVVPVVQGEVERLVQQWARCSLPSTPTPLVAWGP